MIASDEFFGNRHHENGERKPRCESSDKHDGGDDFARGRVASDQGFDGFSGRDLHFPARIERKNATWAVNAARPLALARTVVFGRRATKAFVAST